MHTGRNKFILITVFTVHTNLIISVIVTPECRYFNNFLPVSRATVPLNPPFLPLSSGSSARSWADTVRGREAAATSGPASSSQPPHLRSAEDLRASAGGSSRQLGAPAAAGGHPDQQEEEGWCTVRRARSRYDICALYLLTYHTYRTYSVMPCMGPCSPLTT